MKPYPAYKNSGIDWLGEVPKHWGKTRLKFLLSRNDGGVWGEDPDGDATIVLRSTEIDLDGQWSLDNPAMRKLTTSELNKCLLTKGDILITKSSGSELHIGKSALVDDNIEKKGCCYSNFMQRIRPHKNQNSKYLHYILNSNIVREQYNYLSNTTTGLANLSAGLLNEIIIPSVSLKEQEAIVTFLDKAIKKVETVVEMKQKQIELLKEESTAIINQAVTKGLNPDVPMKDSGIDWIGEVPEHWEIKPLKYLLLDGKDGIKIGPFGSSLKSNILKEDGFKVYGQENVINSDFSLGHRFIDDTKFEELNAYEIFEGDILVTMMGTTGKSKVVPSNIKKGIMDSHLIRIRGKSSVNPHLISLLINDSHYIYSQIKQSSKGSIMEGLNSSIIKSLLVLCPPRTEQDAILSFIYRGTKKIENEVGITKKQITFLQEYRTTLISDAVTGKIDVRNEAESIQH